MTTNKIKCEFCRKLFDRDKIHECEHDFISNKKEKLLERRKVIITTKEIKHTKKE